MNEFPVTRPIEAIHVENDGRRMVSLCDPERFSDSNVLVSLPAFFIITLMDGRRTVDQLCGEFQQQFNHPVAREDVVNLIKQLDDALFLDNERFKEHRESIRAQFLSQPSRPAVFAGKSYPADKDELGLSIDKMLMGDTPQNGRSVKAIIVPHIDFRVGGDMMAAGWREAMNSDVELFIILGIGHSLSDDFFACIDKDFSTPLGTMKVDSKFLKALEKNFGEGIYGQMEAHRTEHSIEFQSLFFVHLSKDRPDFTSVPILLSFPETVWNITHPTFNGERVDRFISALRKTAEEDGRKICFVASVDFSHVGARFGDPGKLTDSALKRIEKDDRDLIDTLIKLDVDMFLEKIVQINQDNRVCGFPALYTLLKVIGDGRGELIEYRQNLESDNETMVSFVTMTLIV